MEQKDIRDFTLDELKAEMAELQEPAFRAKQIFFWLYKRNVRDFSQMKNIPPVLQEKLKTHFLISFLELKQHLRAKDKTEKFLFRLKDGNFIETVLIYSKDRKTICLSTQVGCRFACAFCASGLKGFIRNLTSAEITNQALYLEHTLKHNLTNYVLMGMGEPLDNFENTARAIRILNASEGLAVGSRRITVSTCGIIPGIENLQKLGLQVNLSISLHAPNDKLRNALIPINRRYPLGKLIKACENFIEKKGRKITLEYILLKGKNDSYEDADQLARIARRLKAKVNLILYSVIAGLDFKPATKEDTHIFMQRLAKRGVKATLRHSRGQEIQAACGQLSLMSAKRFKED